jgi:hypothetical protein
MPRFSDARPSVEMAMHCGTYTAVCRHGSKAEEAQAWDGRYSAALGTAVLHPMQAPF